MVSILKGAVDRGTGRKTKIAGFEIGGTTGFVNCNAGKSVPNKWKIREV